MPNLNDEDLKPVSFRRGGLTHEGQVHLEGTYAYLPASLADLSVDDQMQELGDHFFDPGIRRGFAPASESYLANEYQKRISADLAASDASRRSRSGIDLEGPGSATEEIPQGYQPQHLATVSDTQTLLEGPEEGGTPSQHVAQGDLDDVRAADGSLPQGYSLQPSTTDQTLTAEERDGVEELRGRTPAEPSEAPVTTPPAPPWEDAEGLNAKDTEARLADASDDEVRAFVAWEKSRAKPRQGLLGKLETEE